jgi:cyclopropane fatty-acyl-phospholipid synthase-like methyltransferase
MNPVKNDIYTSGEYLGKNPTWGSEDSGYKASLIHSIIQKNNLNPKHIVDIGCGYGAILHRLSQLLQPGARFTGYDISPQAITVAKQYENEGIHFQCTDFLQIEKKNADMILVIDVIEHLQDYLSFLKNLSGKSGHFIFHIPLDLSCRTILKPHITLQQRQDVGHLHYFTHEHVKWILSDTGFQIKDWFYTSPDIDRHKPANLKDFIKKQLRRFSYFLSKDLSVKTWGGYSLMVLCTSNP